MAKQPKPKIEYELPDRVLVVTSRGVEVECLPIATELEQLDINIRGGFTWPECPQRTMRDVAGTEAHVDITPEYLATPGATQDEMTDYALYEMKHREVEAACQNQLANARARLMALRGVRVTDPALPDKWQADHEWLGMAVPADPRDRALHFFLTEIVGNPGADMIAIMSGIYRASGADPEALDKVEASFRNTLGRGKGAGSNGNSASPELEGQVTQAEGV